MKRRIEDGARSMGIALPASAAEKMAAFHRMLTLANERMNLTAIVEPERAVGLHYLDSLAPLRFGLVGEGVSLIDLGTGAGFPGVPLLLARPSLRVTLADSLKKRLLFIENALKELGLEAELVHARAEDLGQNPQYRERFDLACARAVASGPTLLEYLLPLVRLGGKAVCWKGPSLEGERIEGAARVLGGVAQEPRGYEIPGFCLGHRLLVCQKQAITPAKYPRKAGIPAKNPLE
ncbi:MAG: 16S rRNA (guanine(527)-N(7))-methyltransferase RsmG [Christensenellaceae bacterium]|jgi:16S rRNA (guanine527-N7)-methyltransferase|nr:16S rRNA (guanine(527)-N(7))-methyltransferase RsmG [Christensenellaceae bacterium]